MQNMSGLMMAALSMVVTNSCCGSLGVKNMRIGIRDTKTPARVPVRKATKQEFMFELLSYSNPRKAYMPMRMRMSRSNACMK